MNILVINCGSSSLKYQLIDSETENVLAKGLCERIGIDGALTHQPAGKDKIKSTPAMPNHKVAIQLVIDQLTDAENGVVKSLDEISAVGHRVVHGGEKFTSSCVITDDVIKEIEACNVFAPLHNPAALIGINACKELMPGLPMVAVFDTAFHQTMPPKAYLYAIPHEYYEKYGVRRYGFHGTSHQYVAGKAAQMLGKAPEDLKLIICHLGNGASVSAVNGGKCVDTSMGLTPLEGLVMGTRSGDLDPAILEFIAEKENLSLSEVMDVLNKKSGVMGLSGVSSDFRDVKAAAEAGNETAAHALEVHRYRVAKYIGAYAAAMNGVDAIAFTAGLGENDDESRAVIAEYLGYLGAYIDPERNDVHGEDAIISTDDSKVTLLCVPTNEELMIARDTAALVK
ncbi:MAG: acetate kinase [Anaerostipes sp.]|uniref:acetate/propionate family kinase n=1 Tax=Anaerostipes sp. 992a TaxID=1261637 RepID=UPI000952D352|nr:acetate kinase [Anaerostipes sp. 992a]MCI5951718.1 acetate kinase [Anaerostipes sp.]MDD5969072.1 acetate kinase [Anaerostipes sp.]OLR62281.1 acetate kinase [Anaerostipes sp. 992a]